MTAAAYEGQNITVGMIAGATLTAKQYYFVKLSADNTVTVCTAATDIPIGVLQNAPASGATADVCVIGVTKIAADATLSAADIIGTSADSQADAKTLGGDTTEYAVGQVITGSSTAGDYCTAFINCAQPRRAA